MEAWALGVLGWSPRDLRTREFEWLITAWNGYRKDRQEQWEMHRLTGFLAFAGMQGTKQMKTPQKLWKFTWEEIQRGTRRLSTMRKMTRAEAEQAYKARGIELPQWQLDQMEAQGRFKKA